MKAIKITKLLFLTGILTISACVMTPRTNLKADAQIETKASAPAKPVSVATPSLSEAIQPPASQSDAF